MHQNSKSPSFTITQTRKMPLMKRHIQSRAKEGTQNWPDREHSSAGTPISFRSDHEEHEQLSYTHGNQNRTLPEGRNRHLQVHLPPSQVWQHTKHPRLGSPRSHESCISCECSNSHAEISCSREWTWQGLAQYPPTVLQPWNHIFVRNKRPICGITQKSKRGLQNSKLEVKWKPPICLN